MKKLLSMILILSLLFCLTACGEKTTPADNSTSLASNTSNETETVMYDAESYEENEEYPTEEEYLIEEEYWIDEEEYEDPEDPYEDYRIYADEVTEGFFLLKGDRKYTLSGGKPIYSGYENKIGNASDGELCFGYHTYSGDAMILIGDYSPIPVEKNDKIISVSSTGVEPLILNPMHFSGYSAGAIIDLEKKYSRYQFFIIYRKDSYRMRGRDGLPVVISNLEMRGEDGELVEDENNLNYGESYTISWFEGTQYFEETDLIAVNPVYRFDNEEMATYLTYDTDMEGSILINGSLTKNGYAEYDLTGVPAGIYCFNTTEVIEIK